MLYSSTLCNGHVIVRVRRHGYKRTVLYPAAAPVGIQINELFRAYDVMIAHEERLIPGQVEAILLPIKVRWR